METCNGKRSLIDWRPAKIADKNRELLNTLTVENFLFRIAGLGRHSCHFFRLHKILPHFRRHRQNLFLIRIIGEIGRDIP